MDALPVCSRGSLGKRRLLRHFHRARSARSRSQAAAPSPPRSQGSSAKKRAAGQGRGRSQLSPTAVAGSLPLPQHRCPWVCWAVPSTHRVPYWGLRGSLGAVPGATHAPAAGGPGRVPCARCHRRHRGARGVLRFMKFWRRKRHGAWLGVVVRAAISRRGNMKSTVKANIANVLACASSPCNSRPWSGEWQEARGTVPLGKPDPRRVPTPPLPPWRAPAGPLRQLPQEEGAPAPDAPTGTVSGEPRRALGSQGLRAASHAPRATPQHRRAVPQGLRYLRGKKRARDHAAGASGVLLGEAGSAGSRQARVPPFSLLCRSLLSSCRSQHRPSEPRSPRRAPVPLALQVTPSEEQPPGQGTSPCLFLLRGIVPGVPCS